MTLSRNRFAVILVITALISSVATAQLEQIIKIGGIGLLVQRFGGDINRGMNALTKHKDTPQDSTKVVPILSIGIGKSSAIGAAQVMGPKAQVDKVKALAQPETELFGKEVRIRGLIPVSSTDVTRRIDRVKGVGVSGIVDIRL